MEKLGPTGRILMKFNIWVFFENYQNLLRIEGTLHEDQHTFLSYRVQFFSEGEILQTNL
jgi:hypothetical protein